MKEGRFDDSSTRQRIRVIGINLERFAEHPVIGGGIGTASVNDAPHNQFLLIMAEFGSIGAVLYTAFIVLLLLRLLKIQPQDQRHKLLLVYAYTVSYLFFSHNAIYLRFHIIMTAFLCAATEIFQHHMPVNPQLPDLQQSSTYPKELPKTGISSQPALPTDGRWTPETVS